MIDFPIAELLDDSICLIWLERHLHPHGLTCPHCEHSERRVFCAQGHFPAYRCRACNGCTLRRRIQANLNDTAPTAVMRGTAFEADELYQNAGEKNTPHRDPRDSPGRRATKRKGHGTYANDRPPIISVVSRDTGEHRF